MRTCERNRCKGMERGAQYGCQYGHRQHDMKGNGWQATVRCDIAMRLPIYEACAFVLLPRLPKQIDTLLFSRTLRKHRANAFLTRFSRATHVNEIEASIFKKCVNAAMHAALETDESTFRFATNDTQKREHAHEKTDRHLGCRPVRLDRFRPSESRRVTLKGESTHVKKLVATLLAALFASAAFAQPAAAPEPTAPAAAHTEGKAPAAKHKKKKVAKKKKKAHKPAAHQAAAPAPDAVK